MTWRASASRSASLFYDVRHRVEWGLHAIRRNRTLCGLALGYEPDARRSISGSIAPPSLARPAMPPGRRAPGRITRSSSTPPRSPPRSGTGRNWIAVARGVRERGLDVVLPWGGEAERARSEAIAAAGARPDRPRAGAAAAR